MRPATAVLVGLAFVVGLLAGARFDTRRKVHESVSGRDHAKSLEEAMLQATGSRHVLDAGLIAALSDFFKTSSSHEQLLQRVTAAPVPGPSPGPGSGRGPAPTLSALEALPESKPERRPAREADADVATPPHVASTLPQVSQGEATTEARPAGHSERSARALAAAQAPPRAAGRKPFKTLVNPSEPPGYQEGLSGAPYNASCAFVSVFNTEMHFTYFAVMVYTMRMVAKSRCDLVAVIDANAHRWMPKYTAFLERFKVLLFRIRLPTETYISPLYYKIYCWKLVQWDVVVFLDGDTLVRGEVDHLATMPEGSGSCPFGHKHLDMNDGVFVLSPGHRHFDTLLAVSSKMSQLTNGWQNIDRGIHIPVPKGVPAFNSKAISFSEQPMVQWFFERVRRKDPCNLPAVRYNCLIQFDRCDGDAFSRVIHFAGFLKPLNRYQKFNGSWPAPPDVLSPYEEVLVDGIYGAKTSLPGRKPGKIEGLVRLWFRTYERVYPALVTA